MPYPRISMAPVGQLSAASCAVRRQSSGTASVMAWAGAPSSSENTSGQMLGHSPHWIQAFWFTFAYIAAHSFIKIENSCIISIGAGNYSGSGNPCIINVSSIWGLRGASCEVTYSATKGALIALTRSLASELAPTGIRVNCVAPGVIKTDMLDALPPEVLPQLAQETPLGRLGTPEDIAAAVSFLADEKASFITGQVLTCDGGFIL